MILSYIRSAHRNVVRNKVQSFIQILSLAIGLTVFTLVSLYLYDELTVDHSNPMLEQVYRVEGNSGSWHARDAVSLPMGPFILESVPEVSHMTRLNYQMNGSIAFEGETESDVVQLSLINYMSVDSGFQEIFPQDYLLGDPDGLFRIPAGIVLTESISKQLFGDENPLGKRVLMWSTLPKTVTGVIRDPLNTHLKFKILLPMSEVYKNYIRQGRKVDDRSLFYNTFPCYIKLHKGVESQYVEKKISESWSAYVQVLFTDEDDLRENTYLRPLREVHFADIDPLKDYMTHVDKRNLMNFFFLGLGILLLGMINYINLSTARAAMRQKEIAVRKINGASRRSLIMYLLTESVITTFFSFLVAITLVQLLFFKFNHLLVADINLYFLRSPLAWIITLLTILLVGVLAGLYPALSISSESVLSIFSGESRRRGIGLFSRRILMIIQFSSAVILLIGIFTMQRQIHFMQSRNLGFNSEQVVHVGTGSYSDQDRLDLRSRLMTVPEVELVSFSMGVPGTNLTDDIEEVDAPESMFHGIELKLVGAADMEFFEVYDLKFTHGGEILELSSLKSTFNVPLEESNTQYFVINESCRKALNMDDPVGQSFDLIGPNSIIVGVVEDYHFQSLKYPVKPLAIWLRNDGRGWWCSIKINSSDIPKTMEDINKAYRRAGSRVPAEGARGGLLPPLNFSFVDESFDSQYEEVERLQTASVFLSIMAVIIACLGLFGLSTFMAQRRIKEMGIRRALGASEEMVFKLLAKDFLKWVSFSVIIGVPVGYLVMRQWQQQFAFKASIGISVYLLTVALVFMVALTTVTWQSLKASRANPVDSLRKD